METPAAHKPYRSDLTDKEWELIGELAPAPGQGPIVTRDFPCLRLHVELEVEAPQGAEDRGIDELHERVFRRWAPTGREVPEVEECADWYAGKRSLVPPAHLLGPSGAWRRKLSEAEGRDAD